METPIKNYFLITCQLFQLFQEFFTFPSNQSCAVSEMPRPPTFQKLPGIIGVIGI
jgi:hypothetical protein